MQTTVIIDKIGITYGDWRIQERALSMIYTANSQGNPSTANGIRKSLNKARRTHNFRNLNILLEKREAPKRMF